MAARSSYLDRQSEFLCVAIDDNGQELKRCQFFAFGEEGARHGMRLRLRESVLLSETATIQIAEVAR